MDESEPIRGQSVDGASSGGIDPMDDKQRKNHVELPPDPVIEYYKQFLDMTLIRESLKLTVQQRL